MTWNITERPSWGAWATPKAGRSEALHRWFLFPHSFSPDLVQALLQEWNLGEEDRIIDPFVGSGTTLLAAMDSGIPADGVDLSPLAVLVSNGKTAQLSRKRLEELWGGLKSCLEKESSPAPRRSCCDLLRRALPGGRLEGLDRVALAINEAECSVREKEFFELALLAVIPQFSFAAASGGWLRWSNEGARAKEIPEVLGQQVRMMLSDLKEEPLHRKGEWSSRIADARCLPCDESVYAAAVTSPPYPNRHDYTRIFGVELLFAFYDWAENRDLRYQTFESHPEARPDRPSCRDYSSPEGLAQLTQELGDARIRRMLEGYFLDMFICLGELVRVCREGARVALVLGNAQYEGQQVLVDEWTAELGEQAGLVCQEIRVIRRRGNSAQQMGRFGRKAARESVVIFAKP